MKKKCETRDMRTRGMERRARGWEDAREGVHDRQTRRNWTISGEGTARPGAHDREDQSARTERRKKKGEDA